MGGTKEFEITFSIPGEGDFPVVLRCTLERDAYVESYEITGDTARLQEIGFVQANRFEEYEYQWSELIMELLRALPEGSRARRRWPVDAVVDGKLVNGLVSARLYELDLNLTGDFDLMVGEKSYETNNCDSPETFMLRVAANDGPVLRCCGTCVWFDECIYGGTDAYEGNYCFVESGETDRITRWDTSQVKADQDWDDYPQLADKCLVSPFFVCERWKEKALS